MNIRKIIDKERWKTHLYDSDDRVSTNDCHNDSLDRILIGVEKRIAEMGEQTHKVVKPDKTDGGPSKLCRGRCECGNLLVGWEKYCPKCGGKPNWEEA